MGAPYKLLSTASSIPSLEFLPRTPHMLLYISLFPLLSNALTVLDLCFVSHLQQASIFLYPSSANLPSSLLPPCFETTAIVSSQSRVVLEVKEESEGRGREGK